MLRFRQEVRLLLWKRPIPGDPAYTYTYDSYHNVTRATSPTGKYITFTYDTWGNNTSVQDGSNPVYKATAAYTSDGNRMASMTDPLGTTTYTYDTLGNLSAVQAPFFDFSYYP